MNVSCILSFVNIIPGYQFDDKKSYEMHYLLDIC